MAKVSEISYKEFPMLSQMASYQVLGKWQPAVWAEENGYKIRILVKENYNHRTDSRQMGWDYFELDKTGLIIESPRGFAGRFNHRVRITDMPAMVKEYKETRINQ